MIFYLVAKVFFEESILVEPKRLNIYKYKAKVTINMKHNIDKELSKLTKSETR